MVNELVEAVNRVMWYLLLVRVQTAIGKSSLGLAEERKKRSKEKGRNRDQHSWSCARGYACASQEATVLIGRVMEVRGSKTPEYAPSHSISVPHSEPTTDVKLPQHAPYALVRRTQSGPSRTNYGSRSGSGHRLCAAYVSTSAELQPNNALHQRVRGVHN